MSIKINVDELDTLTREELIDLIKLNCIKKHSKEIAENVEKNNKLLAKLKRLNKGE